MTITSATLTGASEFVLSTTPLEVLGPIPFPVVLQPGQVLALVYVHFFPTQAGIRTASVVVTSDAAEARTRSAIVPKRSMRRLVRGPGHSWGHR